MRAHRPLGLRDYAGLVVGLAAIVTLVIVLAPGSPAPARALPPEKTDLVVAAVPAGDSAGFFVALHDGMFRAQGLHVTFVPAISSETVIAAQAAGKYDISCGNYVSYIQAQERRDQGLKSTTAAPAANLEIFAEGSLIEPGTQAIYVMPGSPIRALSGLEGKTIAVNAPGNVLYLLAASALSDEGLSVAGVHFAYIPFPGMAAALKAGTITAAVLPEPSTPGQLQEQLARGRPGAPLQDTAYHVRRPEGCKVSSWGETMEQLNTQLMGQALRMRQFQARHPGIAITYSGECGLGLYDARDDLGHLIDCSSNLGVLLDHLEWREHYRPRFLP